MFNRKKRRIAELTQLVAMWKDQVRVGNKEINRLHGWTEELEERLAHEHDHVSALMRANGQIKRELEEVKRLNTCPEDCAHRAKYWRGNGGKFVKHKEGDPGDG